MRVIAPNASQLLAVWEQGVELSLPRRAMLLLEAVCPDLSGDDIARLPIGRRDEMLTDLRERLFGAGITLVAPCPGCHETLETELRLSDLTLGMAADDAEQTLTVDGYRLAFRLLTAGDLLSLPDDPTAARLMLVSRCIIELRKSDGESPPAHVLPEKVIGALADALSQADPRADLQFALICPSCAHEWSAPFDITTALWKEIHAWAQRTLRDVHALARAYGWREADILTLSATRRQIYLQLSQQ
jgi:hypothetical protein